MALIAELTHRCPLQCVYCSNPVQLQSAACELDTAGWQRVLAQAAEMDILHAHFTGGEPLVRTDIGQLISSAHETGLYTNLISSGIGLTERRLAALIEAGLDHFQLSFQDCDPVTAARIAGVSVHERKVTAARVVASTSLAFTINLVVHRQNLDRIEQLIAFAESFSPQRIEIAHVQYYGWALRNRDMLMPTIEQVEHAAVMIADAEQRLRGRIKVESVTPDYFARYPKPCMGGWGRRLLLVDPIGDVLPCHAAKIIPEMKFENVRYAPLREIWECSDAFQRFRGEDWMPEPCRSCDRRSLDYGGCRCQALLLAGDAAATDPVCCKSPHHELVNATLRQQLVQLNAGASQTEDRSVWNYRSNPA